MSRCAHLSWLPYVDLVCFPTAICPEAISLYSRFYFKYLGLESCWVGLQDHEDKDKESYQPLPVQDLLLKPADELKEIVRGHKDRHRRGYREEKPGKDDREKDIMIPPQNVHNLEGHGSEVFICQWSPKENLLASG
jgi:hypothetical protein